MRRCAIMSRLPCKPLVLQSLDEPSRAAAVVVEVIRGDFLSKVMVATTYGHAACKERATRHNLQVTAALSLRRADWLPLGDFNSACWAGVKRRTESADSRAGGLPAKSLTS